MFILMFMFVFLMIMSFLFMFINIFLSKKVKLSRMKNSSFECGFELFNTGRVPFSIHFYLIAVLFLIFDLEIVYLFPMIISVEFMNYIYWMISSLLILMLLFIGLEYEKKEGSLKWFI